jgi:hypothetical protein
VRTGFATAHHTKCLNYVIAHIRLSAHETESLEVSRPGNNPIKISFSKYTVQPTPRFQTGDIHFFVNGRRCSHNLLKLFFFVVLLQGRKEKKKQNTPTATDPEQDLKHLSSARKSIEYI